MKTVDEILDELVNKISPGFIYCDGKLYKDEYKNKTIALIEYNELISLINEYFKKDETR
jgi:hypothetical protein